MPAGYDRVSVQFESLLRAIKSVADAIDEEGVQAFRRHDYEKANRIVEQARWLGTFQKKVEALQKEWSTFWASTRPTAREIRTPGRRLSSEVRTPEEAFELPILETLVELEGRAYAGEVLARVEAKMKDALTPYDYQPVPSGSELRWRNAARWCRKDLVDKGLMVRDSPRGIWEISEEGRRWLAGQKGRRTD